jgi:hypothetical protein
MRDGDRRPARCMRSRIPPDPGHSSGRFPSRSCSRVHARPGPSAPRRRSCCARASQSRVCRRRSPVHSPRPAKPEPSAGMSAPASFPGLSGPGSTTGALHPVPGASGRLRPPAPILRQRGPGQGPCRHPRLPASARYAGLSSVRRGLSRAFSCGRPHLLAMRSGPGSCGRAEINRPADSRIRMP